MRRVTRWGWLSCGLLVACPNSGGDTQAPATTTTATATGDGPTTSGTSSGAATEASTGVDDQYPCGEFSGKPCEPGELCVIDDGIHSRCLPNLEMCMPSDPCSPACEAVCAGSFPETDLCTSVPGYLSCKDCDAKGCLDCEIDHSDVDCPDGSKCMPWAASGGGSLNATKCTPIDPNPGKPGDPCTVQGSEVSGVDSCEAGAICRDVYADTQMGTCVAFCHFDGGSYTCDDPNTLCAVYDADLLFLCVPACDPLVQDCADGEVCANAGEGFVCVVDASGGGGAFGESCEYANECAPGLACISVEYVPNCGNGGCCSPFCALDVDYEPIPAPAPNCPDPQMACLNWYEAGTALPGKEKVGFCGIPQ